MVLYPNKLPESERVCFGICILNSQNTLAYAVLKYLMNGVMEK